MHLKFERKKRSNFKFSEKVAHCGVIVWAHMLRTVYSEDFVVIRLCLRIGGKIGMVSSSAHAFGSYYSLQDA